MYFNKTFPDELKVADAIPVLKKEDPSNKKTIDELVITYNFKNYWERNRQKTLDKSGVIGTVLIDLGKAYDCLPNCLLMVWKTPQHL